MSEDSGNDGLGRRDALKAGAMAAGGLAIGSVGSRKAEAQTGDERLTLGPEWTLDDKTDGSLQLVNQDSGATLEYDENAGEWSVGSLSTGSVDTEETTFTAPDDGAPVGKWVPEVDPHPYDDADQLDYVLSWTPDSNQNFVPLGLKPPGGIMSFDESRGEWQEFIKLFGGGPVITNEHPGKKLVLESEDLSGSATGGVEVRTGFPGDKRKRFAVWSDTTDSDTATIGANDRAFFDALERVDMYGGFFQLWDSPRGTSGSAVLKCQYDSGTGREVIAMPKGEPFHFLIGGSAPFQITSSGPTVLDDTGQMNHAVHSAAPTNPQVGDVVIADGTNWDPDSDGLAEKVIYNGTTWVEDTDLGTDL